MGDSNSLVGLHIFTITKKKNLVGHEEEEEIPGRWTMPEPTISEGFAAEMFTENYPLGFAIPHVAPDDPCPCGSGLTYRHCHGKYLS